MTHDDTRAFAVGDIVGVDVEVYKVWYTEIHHGFVDYWVHAGDVFQIHSFSINPVAYLEGVTTNVNRWIPIKALIPLDYTRAQVAIDLPLKLYLLASIEEDWDIWAQ